MAVREYIGARYVPIFADPIQWDPTLVYEPLTVVTDQGASYVSRQSVPTGILLSNTDYWILWADYNAQLQHYIDEVNTFDGRIDALEDALPITDFSSVNTVDARFDDIETAIGDNSSGIIKDINDIEIDIAAINNIIADDIILIGDSFIDGSTSGFVANWVTKFENSLPGSTVYNFSDRGAGFVKKGNAHNTNFVDQTNNAVSQITSKAKVSHILVFGGLNDVANNQDITSCESNATSIVNTLTQNFPKAKIVVCACNASIGMLVNADFKKLIKYYRAIKRGVNLANRFASVEFAGYWLCCGDDSYFLDNIHPSNVMGNRIMLANVYKALFGIGDWYSVYAYADGSVGSTYEGTWIEDFYNHFSEGFAISNGIVDIPSFFIQINPTNYIQIAQGSTQTFSLAECASLNSSKNPITVFTGYWSSASLSFTFRVVINHGTKQIGIQCMDGTMPASVSSNTYVFFTGCHQHMGNTSV